MRVISARRTARFISALAVTLLIVTSFLAYLSSPAKAAQTIPYMINFQGRLTDNNGNILPDGSYNIKFRIFDALSAGVNKWEGDRVFGATDHRVVVANGLFNTQFGDTSLGDPALSPSLFSGTYPLYLEVELPTPATATCNTNACAAFTEGAMTPRQALASAPYAFNSDTLDGLDSTAFGQLGSAQTWTNTNTFQPTTNVSSLLVKQNSSGSFGQDIFAVQGSSSGNFIQITSTAANAGAVTVQSLGASNTLNLDSAGALNVGAANATAINLGRTGLGVTVPATGVVAVSLTGVPASATTSSLIQLTAAIASGSSSGTYIGANPTSFSGDFANLQVNGSTRFKLNSFGDVTSGFTLLDGSTTTNGTSGLTPPSTSLTLTDASLFDIGNYVQVNDVNCGGTGVNPCYAKITAKAGNLLTISPGLTWTTGKNVLEYHVPELGGVDLTQALANRYGRGYFISGVATGNGTTFYNEGDVTSSLAKFDFLNTTVTTLNIGGAATTLSLGASGSTLTIPGNITINGTISGGAPGTGTSGYISRSGAILSPATAGDSFNTSGNIATTGSGTITSAGALTAPTATNTINGLVISSGALSSITTIGLSGAITGATATNTINGLVINSGALSSVTGVTLSSGNITTPGNIFTTGSGTITSAGAITAPTVTNTINGAIINAGALSSITTIGLSGAITGATATNTINGLVINSSALSNITTIGLSGAITGATATNTINGLVINGGSLTNVGANITGVGAVTLASGASSALNLTGSAVSTWDIGANALSLQTLGNGTITTGSGLVTHGGNLSVSGTYNTNTFTSSALTFGAVSAATVQSASNQNLNLAAQGTGNLTLTGTKIQIGSATTDTTQANLQLDSFSTFADTGTCNATTNQGAIYYSTSTNAIRGCANGGWQDVVTSDALGAILYGVMPDSGSNPGDLAGLQTGSVTGPCKVSASATSTTQVVVQPCTAYSSGRKVEVGSTTTLTLSGMATTNIWQHVCFSATTGAIGLTSASTETTGFPTWTAAAPALCIADVLGTSGSSVVVAVYDTRTFTTSQKEYTTSAASLGIGQLIVSSGNGVAQAAATAGLSVRGVVVASSGAASVSNAPSGIIVTSGPAFIKATAGSANALVQSGATTAGYATTTAVPVATTITCTTGLGAGCTPSVASTFYGNPYAYIGYTKAAFPGSACTAGVAASPVNCDRSLYTVINLR